MSRIVAELKYECGLYPSIVHYERLNPVESNRPDDISLKTDRKVLHHYSSLAVQQFHFRRCLSSRIVEQMQMDWSLAEVASYEKLFQLNCKIIRLAERRYRLRSEHCGTLLEVDRRMKCMNYISYLYRHNLSMTMDICKPNLEFNHMI